MPIPLTAQIGNLISNGATAHSQTVGQLTNGFMQDVSGTTPFSFNNGSLGMSFNAVGKTYSLMPDFISKCPFGRSWVVSLNGQSVGSLGFDKLTNGFNTSGGLGAKLGAGMASALSSSGAV